jgi:hypothetical protein
MVADHVLSGLLRKRAELAGEIEHADTMLRQLRIDLDALDQTIRLFDPDIDLEEIKPKPLPPRHQAFRGELSRLLLDTLRQSNRPMSVQELASRVMAERGLNATDKRLARAILKRVGAALRHLRSRSQVRSQEGTGQGLVWEIAG